MIHDFYFVFYSILSVKISDGLGRPASVYFFLCSIPSCRTGNAVERSPLVSPYFTFLNVVCTFHFPFPPSALLCVVLGYIALVMRDLWFTYTLVHGDDLIEHWQGR